MFYLWYKIAFMNVIFFVCSKNLKVLNLNINLFYLCLGHFFRDSFENCTSKTHKIFLNWRDLYNILKVSQVISTSQSKQVPWNFITHAVFISKNIWMVTCTSLGANTSWTLTPLSDVHVIEYMYSCSQMFVKGYTQQFACTW